MRIAIDTNRYVDFAKGLPEAVERVRGADQILVPFVVLGELRAGFLGGARRGENEANFARFLHSPRVDLLFADEETTHHYARLFHQLRRQGTPTRSLGMSTSTTFRRSRGSEGGRARGPSRDGWVPAGTSGGG